MPDVETGQQTTSEQAAEAPASFEAWLDKQPDTIKGLYEQHTTGLRTALQAEREARKRDTGDLSRQLREAAKKVEEGSEARKSLEATAAQLDAAEKRAAFMEDAVRPEVQCKNPRAAFVVAMSDGLFTKKGEPDWPAIKAATPELFGPRVPAGDAGAGTATPPPSGGDMNTFIRRGAGRQ